MNEGKPRLSCVRKRKICRTNQMFLGLTFLRKEQIPLRFIDLPTRCDWWSYICCLCNIQKSYMHALAGTVSTSNSTLPTTTVSHCLSAACLPLSLSLSLSVGRNKQYDAKWFKFRYKDWKIFSKWSWNGSQTVSSTGLVTSL